MQGFPNGQIHFVRIFNWCQCLLFKGFCTSIPEKGPGQREVHCRRRISNPLLSSYTPAYNRIICKSVLGFMTSFTTYLIVFGENWVRKQQFAQCFFIYCVVMYRC